MTIGAPDSAPATAARPAGEAARDFTVSVPVDSSRASNSPSQRKLAPGSGAGRRSRNGTYASTDSTAGDPSDGWCGDVTLAQEPRVSDRNVARLSAGTAVSKVR